MARTRSPKYEDIQLGILRKAARLFATHGYERTSIGDLVRACDLARAIYHYFESRRRSCSPCWILSGPWPARAADRGGGGGRRACGATPSASSRLSSPTMRIAGRAGDLAQRSWRLSRSEQKQIKQIETEIVELRPMLSPPSTRAARSRRRPARFTPCCYLA